MADETASPEKELLVFEINQVLNDIPDFTRGYRRSEEQTERQQEIISNLPLSFKDDLRKHLDKRGEERGVSMGFVLENLVRADAKLFGKLETPAAAELRQVLNDPEEFGLGWALGGFKNPDIALVDETGVFTGYAEVKGGKLNESDLRQLRRDGSEATVEKVVKVLHDNHRKLASWGLPALAAKEKRELTVVPAGFRRVLVMPLDRDFSDITSLIKSPEDGGPTGHDRELLEKILGQEVELEHAAFSLEEVWKITDSLLVDLEQTT